MDIELDRVNQKYQELDAFNLALFIEFDDALKHFNKIAKNN